MKLAQFGSRDFLKAIRPFVGLFLVLLLFAIDAELRSLFFKGGNFKTILTQTVIVAIGAMGMTLVIVSGGIDLSAGSLVALCSVCLLYTSPSPRDLSTSRMPSSA